MTHKTLYSKDAAGKTRIWYCETDGSKYRMVSGTEGGKLVYSTWTAAKPKNVGRANATTAEQQALTEVEARYEKQLKSTRYAESVEAINKWPHFPMLAQTYEPGLLNWEDGSYVAQVKLNGHRMIATKDGCFTREYERYVSIPHIEKALKPLFEEHPDLVLDGELFNFQLRAQLNELSKLVRLQKPKLVDFSRSAAIVQYHVYDGYCKSLGLGPQEGYEYRRRRLYLRVGDVSENCLKTVETHTAYNEESFSGLYEMWIGDGHEGAMLRDNKAPYESDIRSKHLLKRKPEDEAEFVIKEVLPGQGNWSGMAKIIVLHYKDDECRATFKGTQEDAKKMLAAKAAWVGKEVSIKYNGLTGLGKLNFAQFDYANALKKAR